MNDFTTSFAAGADMDSSDFQFHAIALTMDSWPQMVARPEVF